MSIEITARHVEVADSMKDHARSRAEELMAEFPRIEHIHVILDHVRYQYVAEFVVQAKNHIHIEASESNEIIQTAIDAAVHKAERQLRKARSKAQDHRAEHLPEPALPDDNDNDSDDDDEVDDGA